uniref:WD40 repeat-like protein n=1 Tax=Steinernema glaseri TaxID=37863 RepID=A0A1I8ARZ3_9BILA
MLRVAFLLVCLAAELVEPTTPATPTRQLHYPKEKRLKNVKQLTFGGMNAEGYFSYDDKFITFQATGGPYGTECDQIYQMDLTKDPKDPTNIRKISPGLGSTTCSYFYGNNKDSLFAGNFHKMLDQDSTTPGYNTCPPKKCRQKYNATSTLGKLCNTSYTWDIYQDYDIFKVNQYGNIKQQLTKNNVYDAEATFSPDGSKIVFTSMRSGDLELYLMNTDGSNVKQLTTELGYDGGAFFSRDGKKIIWRASRPNTTAEIEKYKTLLSYDLVEPLAMELFVMNVDGSNKTQVTKLGSANWAPFYLNDSRTIIFSSNHEAGAAGGYNAFALYTIRDDGTNLERITYGDGDFNSFPMMNFAGTKLIWGSSRMGGMTELDLFIADWVYDDSKGTVSVFSLSSAILTATISLIGYVLN